MGNRSYFYIKKSESESEILFEGNNTTACFWIMMLEKEDIDQLSLNLTIQLRLNVNNDKSYSDDPVNTDIILDKNKAIETANKRLSYIKKCYPQLEQLYIDWINYLASRQTFDSCFYIDLYEISWFYKSPEHFAEDLYADLANFEFNEPTIEEHITFTCGWACEYGNEAPFSSYSEAYKVLSEKEWKPRKIQAHQLSNKKYPKLYLFKIINYAWGFFGLISFLTYTTSIKVFFENIFIICLILLFTLPPILFGIIMVFVKIDHKRNEYIKLVNDSEEVK